MQEEVSELVVKMRKRLKNDKTNNCARVKNRETLKTFFVNGACDDNGKSKKTVKMRIAYFCKLGRNRIKVTEKRRTTTLN